MLLSELGRNDVITTSADATAYDAAKLMREEHVGALVVVSNHRPIGIVTDRDLAIEVLASGRPSTVRVAEIMTPHPTTVRAESGLADAALVMREHGVRRLPVVTASGELCGIVTLDDILALLGEELASLAAAVDHEQVREWRERGKRLEDAA
jgi:CBS domain-containing protein